MENHQYFWLFLIINSCSGSGTGFNDDPAIDPRLYNLDWMKSVPDETLISALSIPGTHESLSLHGGPLAKCQVWTLDKQLNLGVRYFDLHGKVTKLMTELIDKNRNKIWTKSSIPNMQQVRGNIVLLQSDTFYRGIENQESTFFENKKLINVEAKIRNIKSQLCDHHVVLTDSAASRLSRPKTLAQTLNKQLDNFVVQHEKSSSNQGCLGVLSMNFPSADLIKNIIQLKPCNCVKGGKIGDGGRKIQVTTEPKPKPTSSTSEQAQPKTEPNITPEAAESTLSGLESTPKFEEKAKPVPEPQAITSGDNT
ncbi:1-phosphatidylinositol phosphodiesterase-like [Hippoglossus stenolepis]|uniref:1-phosphatidylinositol phosphodiesterase-like n=1 Tax=Hippoglossus stenolepis TaxID=195615 RepID=UPI001FAEC40B|nr:1-phosphatidylinositol phosphodiesterase-like [Hippoglossus stenolepis]